MMIRTRRETVVFKHPFHLRGVERILPAGSYQVVMDDEMIEGLSFPCFRRVSTLIMVPGQAPHANMTEMITIAAVDLADAQRDDAIASLG